MSYQQYTPEWLIEEQVKRNPERLPLLFRDWRVRVLSHVLFWVFMYIDVVFSWFGLTEPWDLDLVLEGLAGDMFAVYINLYVLIPRLLQKGKYILYLITSAGLAIFSAVWSYYIFWDLGCTDCSWSMYLSDFLLTAYQPTLTLVGTAIALKLFKYYFILSNTIQQENQLTINTKMRQLRNQLNAHFLLNSLNNLYVLSKTSPKKASKYLLYLSEVLRFHLYESTLSLIKLSKEIDFLRDYLELEKLRGQFRELRLHVQGHPERIKVAPLLFVPFVENAVKHGGKPDGSGFIDVQFIVEADRLTFMCKNSRSDRSLDKPGGMGMIMAYKRFELLYPNRFAIFVAREPETWTVTVLLSLEKQLDLHEYSHALHHSG